MTRIITPPYIGSSQPVDRYAVPDPRFEMPELLIPGKKPIGPVKANPDAPIEKNILIVFPSNRLAGFKELARNYKLEVSDNHGGVPWEHWHYHPMGLWDYYGGDYTIGERLDVLGVNGFSDSSIDGGSTNTIVNYALGATFTLIGTSAVYGFFCIGDNDGITAGHVGTAYNYLKIANDTTIILMFGAKAFTFTVPNLRDGRVHSAIGIMGYDGSFRWAQLVLDGVVYAKQEASYTDWFSRFLITTVTSGSNHHNRVLNGVVHMVWAVRDKMVTIDQAIAETKDPYIAVSAI